jgi:hypothetical protein
MRGVLAGNPTADRSVVASSRGQSQRGARVPRLEEGQAHPGPGRATRRIDSPGSRPATQRGRGVGRRERRVLRQARTWRARRRIRGRSRGDRPGTPARRRRAGPSLRPGTHHREHRRAPTPHPTLVDAVDDPPEPPVGSRRRDRRGGLRPQRPNGPSRREPARPRLLRRRLRRSPPTAEHRPIHLPRPQRPALLPQMGPRRRHLRRHPAPKPAAPLTTRGSTTSSASSRPAATSSAHDGAPTTSATTAPARSGSTTASSATSNSPTKASTWRPNPASPSPSTPPSPAPPPTKPSASSPPGQPPRTLQPPTPHSRATDDRSLATLEKRARKW